MIAHVRRAVLTAALPGRLPGVTARMIHATWADMKRSVYILVLVASSLAVLGALLLLLVLPVSVSFDTPEGEASVACGTAFTADPVSRACPGAQTTREWWGFGLLAAGVAGGVGGLVVRRTGAPR